MVLVPILCAFVSLWFSKLQRKGSRIEGGESSSVETYDPRLAGCCRGGARGACARSEDRNRVRWAQLQTGRSCEGQRWKTRDACRKRLVTVDRNEALSRGRSGGRCCKSSHDGINRVASRAEDFERTVKFDRLRSACRPNQSESRLR